MANPRKMEKISMVIESVDEHAVDEKPFAPAVPAVPVRISAEDAAYELLGYLPDDVQALIKEAKEAQQKPMWQLLLSYAMRMAELGELFVPYDLVMWESGQKADAPRKCQSCGDLFVSRFPNAAYCCTPCFFKKAEELGHAEDCPLIEFEAPVTSEVK